MRFLRRLDEADYPNDELRKRYTESSRKQPFIDRCLLLADGCIHMNARSADSSNGVTYEYSLKGDYFNPSNEYYFLVESEYIHPDLCYLRTEVDEDDILEMHYLVEIFDLTTPRYMIRKKLKDYVAFLDSGDWEEATETELPIVHIVCPTVAELIYAKRYTRKQLEAISQEDNEDFCIRFTTVEQIKRLGMTGRVWEDILRKTQS